MKTYNWMLFVLRAVTLVGLLPDLRMSSCIVCGSQAGVVSEFPEMETRLRMESMFDSLCERCPSIPSYRVLRCGACGLEFADPMQSPGPEFYSWLSREGTGSPGLRWEWVAAKALVAARARAGDTPIKVLDIGCREGEFLDLLASTVDVVTIGFDLNPEVAKIAASKGHVVSVGTFDEVRALLPADLAFITLWHVVEHLADPVELLSSARTLLAADGAILFSVPVSPMSHELTGMDPLNNPPHHLTR